MTLMLLVIVILIVSIIVDEDKKEMYQQAIGEYEKANPVTWKGW